MFDANQNEGAAAQADYANLFEADRVTATVNPASASATVDTGPGDVDATLTPAQPAARTVNTLADTGEPEGAAADLNARVAALLPDKPTTDWNAISAFMASVVPWPVSPQDPGYVNLHYSYPDRTDPTKKGKGVPGYPFRSVDTLVSKSHWMLQQNFYWDQWFCLSLQSKQRHNHKYPNKPKAERLAHNALAVKAV